MRRSRAAGAVGVVGAVVVGVVLVRGGTAVDAEDLARARAEAAPSPSAAASPEASAPAPALLRANGLPGLRLGAVPGPRTEVAEGVVEVPAAGERGARTCGAAHVVPGSWDTGGARLGGSGGTADATGDDDADADVEALDRLAERMSVTAWLVDGVVASVRVQAWEPPVATVGTLRSWAGVTIGSPVEVASELPGARTTRERPWPDQPAVTVVRVPLQGGGTELVVADAPVADLPDLPTSGRVTSLEVRTAAGAECTRAGSALWPAPGDDDPVVVTEDGAVGDVRVGADAVALEAAGALAGREQEGMPPGCRWYGDARDRVSVVARDGTVSRVHVSAPFRVGTALSSGDTIAELLAGPLAPRVSASAHVPPSGTDPVDPFPLESAGAAFVHLDGVVLEVWFHREHRPVREVGSWVPGGEPVAESLGLLAPPGGDVDPWTC